MSILCQSCDLSPRPVWMYMIFMPLRTEKWLVNLGFCSCFAWHRVCSAGRACVCVLVMAGVLFFFFREVGNVAKTFYDLSRYYN